MSGICLIWSRGRLISPSLPIGDDGYLNLSSQKRPPGRNLGEHRLVRRSGTTSRGTVVLVFCWRMRRFLLTLVLTIFVGMECLRHLLVPVSLTCGRTSHLVVAQNFVPKIDHFVTILPYYSLCKVSKNGNTSPLYKILFFYKQLDLFKTYFFALFKSKIAV